MELNQKFQLFDLFINGDSVSLMDIKDIGCTETDIEELLKDKTLFLNDEGSYSLGKVQDLISYLNVLYQQGQEQEKYRLILNTCFRLWPRNRTVATLLFSDAIIDSDFSTAFEYFECMEMSRYIDNMRDRNLWLLLLSYITEVPAQYMDRLNKLRCDDILIAADNKRGYVDVDNLNKIRILIFEGDLEGAKSLLESIDEAQKDDVRYRITRNLLYKALENYHVDSDSNESYYDLIVNEQFLQLVQLLEKLDEERKLTFSEFCLLNLAKDMVSMISNEKVLKSKDCQEINFVEAIIKHNYDLALQLNRCSSLIENCSSNEAVSLMLTKVVEKRDQVRLKMESRHIGSKYFPKFLAALMQKDYDQAFEKLDIYLGSIGKSQYRDYILSLVKLSLAEDDKAYVEVMFALASMGQNDFHLDISSYLQDFYFSLVSKDYKMASVYLEILDSASKIEGIIDTLELRNSLVSAVEKAGIDLEEVSIKIPQREKNTEHEIPIGKVEVEEVQVKEEEDETALPKEESRVVENRAIESKVLMDELVSRYPGFSNVVEMIDSGDNLILLEPMSKEDTDNVLYLASHIPDTEVTLVDTVDGTLKHIMIKHNGGAFMASGSELIRAANSAYYEKRYADCTYYLENFVSGCGNPKSFIYAKLGLAYRYLGTDEGSRNAIDYLTVATSKSRNDFDGDYDFTKIVSDLKESSGYNGVRVLGVIDDKKKSVQYEKKQ